VSSPLVYECIICGETAKERPPRRCPRCDTPASRWRIQVDRKPVKIVPPPANEPTPDAEAG
jgi:hypothetical protein